MNFQQLQKLFPSAIESQDKKPGHWHQHKNPDGTTGGWVENTAYVANTAHVGPDALVFGNAQVHGCAYISENAKVFGNARVYENAKVFGNALVYGNAQVSGNAQVHGCAYISENAKVSGNAQVHGCAYISENAKVFGNAQVYENAKVSGNAQVYENAKVSGNAQVYENAQVYGNKTEIERGSIIYNLFEGSTTNMKVLILGSLGLLPNNEGYYWLYKTVKSNLSAFWDTNFKYRVGEWVSADNTDENPLKDCAPGLHFSHPTYFRRPNDVDYIILRARIHISDIISCIEGKIRAKKAFIESIVELT